MLRSSFLFRHSYKEVSHSQFKGIVLSSLHKKIEQKRNNTTNNNTSSSSSPKSILIDVREGHELKSRGHVPFALHVPLGELSDTLLDAANYGRDRRLQEHRQRSSPIEQESSTNDEKDNHEDDTEEDDPVVAIGAPGEKQIVFFCQAGVRSQYAIDIAETCGYQNCCSHYKGGYSTYCRDPVAKADVEEFANEKERNE